MLTRAPDVRDDDIGWFGWADDVGGTAGLPGVLHRLGLPGDRQVLQLFPVSVPPEDQNMGAADAPDAARQGTGCRPQQLDLKEESDERDSWLSLNQSST